MLQEEDKVDQELVYRLQVFYFGGESLDSFHVRESWHGAAFPSWSCRMCDTPGNVCLACFSVSVGNMVLPELLGRVDGCTRQCIVRLERRCLGAGC